MPPGVAPATSDPAPGLAGSPTVEPTPEFDSPQPLAPKTAADTVAIPTDDGGYVTVRDSVKTVQFQGEEVEVRRLTPEEKQRKRLIRNIITAIIGILFLTIVAIVLVILT